MFNKILKKLILITIGILVAFILKGNFAVSQNLPQFNFTNPQTIQGWQSPEISNIQNTAEGVILELAGLDPQIISPPLNFPTGQPLWLHIRLKSEQAGMAQIFYFKVGTPGSEGDSVPFPVSDKGWQEIRLQLPPLGPAYHIRFDPPGTTGKIVLASLRFEPRLAMQAPAWPQPSAPTLTNDSFSIRSGDLELIHNRNQLGGFNLKITNQQMATGFTRPLIGYQHNNQLYWLDFAKQAKVNVTQQQNSLLLQATAQDTQGANWQITQRFSPSNLAGAIDLETQVTVNQDRSVIFLPMFNILPGVGSFGQSKGQAVFPGLEYLDKNEPSSSEADITGPPSKRQVPDTLKLTFPLMAIQANDRYVGLIWEQNSNFSPLFDSPDRLFKSGGHIMGVIFPGSNGQNRAEGSLLPYEPQTIKASKPLTLRATVIGGKGQNIVPAIQQYVALRGLPAIPNTGLDFQNYISLAAAGWLDSKIRENNRYHHMYWPGARVTAIPAADATMLIEWLASKTKNQTLSQRLKDAAKDAITQVPPVEYNTARVSHIYYPVPSLLYGSVAENAKRAQEQARNLIKNFQPDGSLPYKRPANGPDLGKTHFAPDANGLTAASVVNTLELATVSGEPEIIRESLRLLRALDKFASTVPRGAQTWEIPLHTPDILASAHLVRAYTLGYELTGESHFLEQARYWAWTGVPFIYLVNPTSQPVGLYSTISVFGATGTTGPVWMGLPVQWCGLVYADALYRFLRHDQAGPWKQLADGITASGIQQTWPQSDPNLQGLLPDSFVLGGQIRQGVAINPGTLQTNAVRLFNTPSLYDFHVFRTNNIMVHAPGTLSNLQENKGEISFTVQSWLDRPYNILVVGLKATPRVFINNQEVSLNKTNYIANEGRLILGVSPSASIKISLN